MRKGDKKGLSPIIGAVLLIALVMVIAFMIFLWAKGFFSEQVEKFGEPVESLCSEVDFEISRIQGAQGYDTLEVLNVGNLNLWGFLIKKYYDGDSEIIEVKLGVSSGAYATGEAYLRFGDSGTVPERIEVYPILSGTVNGQDTRRTYSCDENSAYVLE